MSKGKISKIIGVNFSDLIRRLSLKTGIRQKNYTDDAHTFSIESVTKMFLQEILDEVKKGKKVVISGFGTFYLEERFYANGDIEGELRFIPAEVVKSDLRASRIAWVSLNTLNTVDATTGTEEMEDGYTKITL